MAKKKSIGNMLVQDIIEDIIPANFGMMPTFDDILDYTIKERKSDVKNSDNNTKSGERKILKPSAWTCKYTNIRGSKFSFKSRPYQHQIINDLHPNQVIKKAAQLGISQIMLTKLFWFGDYSIGGPSAKIIYTFPTYSDMLTYSAARIPPIINESVDMTPAMYGWLEEYADENMTYIQSMMEVNSAKLKKIRDTFLFLKGTMGDNSAISVDSDWNIHDEINFSNPSILNKFKSRLGASKLGWEYNFSTPTIPAYGVSKLFNKSDQHFWYIKCPHCNHSYKLDFDRNLKDLSKERANKEQRKYFYQCHYCGNEITDETRAKGFYVSEQPSVKDLRGYHIDKMISPIISADDLMDSKEGYTKRSDFYNFDLGIDYSEKTTSISLDVLEPLHNTCGVYDMWSTAKPEHLATMGVDQGDTLWVEISVTDASTGKRKVVYAEKIDYTDFEDEDPFQRLPDLMERYNVWVCVIDALPNKNDSRGFKNMYLKDKRVFMAYYTSTKDGDINVNEDDGIVNIDRTETFKWVFNRIYSGDIGIPSNADIIELWKEHMCNLKKETIEDESTGAVKEFFERTGADHFNHAHLYDEVAYQILTDVLKKNKTDSVDGIVSKVNNHWALRKGFIMRNGVYAPQSNLNNINRGGYGSRVGGVSTIPSSIRRGR
jgi:DNA-directed RNA polymerase subunit RPC12/RpoP